MYLLVDFSNAARRLLTRTKLAELKGALGKATELPADLKNLRYYKNYEAKDLKKGRKTLAAIRDYRDQANKALLANPTRRGYVDAIQIARRGSTTPIKANTYIAREGWASNPQDNTVIAASIDKIRKQTLKDGKEQAFTITKNKSSEKVKPTFIQGNSKGVDYSSRGSLLDAHTHPLEQKTIQQLPSRVDLNLKNKDNTSLIISTVNDEPRIVKYKGTNKLEDRPPIGKYFDNYKKEVRSKGGDYKIITRKTKQ
jgi:hypothetical protein